MPGSMALVTNILGWGVLQLGWQTAVVAGLVWVLRRAGRKAPPHWRYRIAWLSLVSLPILPAATGAVLLSGDAPAAIRTGGVASSPVVRSVMPVADSLIQRTTNVVPWLGLAWWVVIVAACVCFIVGVCSARRVVRRSTAPPEELQAMYLEVAARLNVRARLRVSAEVQVPTILGVIRPTVLVPEGLVHAPRSELSPLLAHELAHVQRGDHRDNALQFLVRAILVFHPLTRWICRQIDLDRECACDDLAAVAVEDRRRYAASLARLELSLGRTGVELALGGDGAPIVERVRRMVAPPHRLGAVGWVRMAAIAILGGTILIFGACTGVVTGAEATRDVMHRVTAIHTVRASDPAGVFTLSIRRGLAVAATIDGRSVRFVQHRDSVTLVPDPRLLPFTVRVGPNGGIHWSARKP